MKDYVRKLNKSANGSHKMSASIFSFAGSNKNLSSKNNKEFQLRSDDSNKSKTRKSNGNRRSFVYEDDNTLLEYPTSPSTVNLTKNIRSLKKSLSNEKCDPRSNRTDLKENMNPELASSNNTHDNSLNINSQTMSLDTIDENTFVQSQKDVDQRLVRRNSRNFRHFRSVQESDFTQNDQTNGDLIVPGTTDSISLPFLKPYQTNIGDQSVKDYKPMKMNNNSGIEENKHLKNIDKIVLNKMNFSKLTLTNKFDNEICAVEDSKVIIDVQNNIKLNSIRSNLFFNIKNNGDNRLRDCKIDEKMKVEFKFGEKKFLVKSRSNDCLLELDKYSHLPLTRILSKSLNDLSNINSNDSISLTDKADDTEKKVRRSERRKSKLFETHETVK